MPSSADSTTSQHRRKSTEASNLPPPPFGPPRCEPQSDCSETVMHLENAGSATWEIAALPEAGGASRAGWSRFGHFSSYVQVARKDTSGSVR